MILVREEDRLQAERKRKKLLFSYVAIAVVYAVVALSLLFLSPDAYRLYLVTIAFGFYSIFFFSVAYDDATKMSRLLDKIDRALSEKEYGVFVKEEESKTIEGVLMRILLFRVRDDLREVRCLSPEFRGEEGRQYLLELRCGVLVEIGGDE